MAPVRASHGHVAYDPVVSEQIEVVVGRIGKPHGLRGRGHRRGPHRRAGAPVRRRARRCGPSRPAARRARTGRSPWRRTRWHQGRLLATFEELGGPHRRPRRPAASCSTRPSTPTPAPTTPTSSTTTSWSGWSPYDLDGRELGEVTGLVHGGAQDLLKVRTAGRSRHPGPLRQGAGSRGRPGRSDGSWWPTGRAWSRRSRTTLRLRRRRCRLPRPVTLSDGQVEGWIRSDNDDDCGCLPSFVTQDMVGGAKRFMRTFSQGGPMKVSTPMRATAVAAALVLGLAACGGGDSEEDPSRTPAASRPARRAASTSPRSPSRRSSRPARTATSPSAPPILDMINDPLVTDRLRDRRAGLRRPGREHRAQRGPDGLDGDPQGGPRPSTTASRDCRVLRATPGTTPQDPKNAQATAGFMARIEGAGEGKEMSGF